MFLWNPGEHQTTLYYIPEDSSEYLFSHFGALEAFNYTYVLQISNYMIYIILDGVLSQAA
jgi:hypothetical protein